jgi:hypothetical protein
VRDVNIIESFAKDESRLTRNNDGELCTLTGTTTATTTAAAAAAAPKIKMKQLREAQKTKKKETFLAIYLRRVQQLLE